MTALMIPELPSSTELITVDIRPAARDGGFTSVVGPESDTALDSIVGAAHRYIKAGFSPGQFVGEDGLAYGYLTDEVKTRTLLRIQELVAEAQARAEVLVAEHQDALIFIATAVYEKRRLSDERLDEVLVAAGFTLPQPTA